MTQYITIKREVVEQALEALEMVKPDRIITWRADDAFEAAISALRTALEQPAESEPVAWHGITGDYGFPFLSFQEQPGMTPLYTHPAPAVPESVEHLRDLLGKANALCRIRQERIKELVGCIERMRVSGGSHEFQMAFELAKDAIGHRKDTTLTEDV